MALKEKYQELLTAALASGVTDLKVKEHRGMLSVEGIVPSEEVKQKLWDLYGKLSNYNNGDLVMKLSLDGDGTQDDQRLR